MNNNQQMDKAQNIQYSNQEKDLRRHKKGIPQMVCANKLPSKLQTRTKDLTNLDEMTTSIREIQYYTTWVLVYYKSSWLYIVLSLSWF